MKELFVQLKIFVQRAMSYMTFISAGSLLFLVADKLKNYGFNWSILKLFPLLALVSLGMCLLLGWFDLRSGIYEEELRYGSKNNPYQIEMIERLERIEARIK